MSTNADAKRSMRTDVVAATSTIVLLFAIAASSRRRGSTGLTRAGTSVDDA
jgi:hypothetical protein